MRQVQGEVKITHWGAVDLITKSASGFITLHLDEVLHIPTVTFNLLSLQRLIDSNVTPIFNIIPTKAVFSKLLSDDTQQHIGLLIDKGRLTLDYNLATQLPTAKAEILSCELTIDLLHRRHCHSGQPALQRLLSADMVLGSSTPVMNNQPFRLQYSFLLNQIRVNPELFFSALLLT